MWEISSTNLVRGEERESHHVEMHILQMDKFVGKRPPLAKTPCANGRLLIQVHRVSVHRFEGGLTVIDGLCRCKGSMCIMTG